MRPDSEIETERLILRRWLETDAANLYRYASDERVCRMALWPVHTSEEMSLQVIREYFIPNRDTYAITLKNTGETIGCIGLVPEEDEHYQLLKKEREAGYWIGYPYWGKGLTTEALTAIIKYYKKQEIYDSLLITAASANTASLRVAEKCGFRMIDEYEWEGIASKAFRLFL